MESKQFQGDEILQDITAVVRTSRLTGPVNFNLADDKNIEQFYKVFFMSENSLFTSRKLKIDSTHTHTTPPFKKRREREEALSVCLDICVRLSPLNRSIFITKFWTVFKILTYLNDNYHCVSF